MSGIVCLGLGGGLQGARLGQADNNGFHSASGYGFSDGVQGGRFAIAGGDAGRTAETSQCCLNSDWFYLKKVPLGRLELPFLAPEANALSTELQGRVRRILPQRIYF